MPTHWPASVNATIEPERQIAEAGGQRILACDVGNSRVKFGVLSLPEPAVHVLPACLSAAAFPVDGKIDWDQIVQWVNDGVTSAYLAGANPCTVERIRTEWTRTIDRIPLIHVSSPPAFLKTAVDSAERAGIDRLLNAVAANAIRRSEQPVVIVDSGTATTVDVVDSHGVFQGGAILPGLDLAAKSLNDYTALLPRISIDELAANTRHPVGRNTRDAICSGLFWGQVGAVRELVGQLENDLQMHEPNRTSPLILLTGGGAAILADRFPEARFEPHLSLQGLTLAANSPNATDETPL